MVEGGSQERLITYASRRKVFRISLSAPMSRREQKGCMETERMHFVFPSYASLSPS